MLGALRQLHLLDQFAAEGAQFQGLGRQLQAAGLGTFDDEDVLERVRPPEEPEFLPTGPAVVPTQSLSSTGCSAVTTSPFRPLKRS